MYCCHSCLGFLWNPLANGLENFLQNSTGEAASWIWNQIAGRIIAIFQLDSRAEELDREMRDLIDVRTDLLAEIRYGELQNKGPTQQTRTWLEQVQKIEDRAADFRLSFLQKGDAGVCCFVSSSHGIGREVVECLKEVRRLKTQKDKLPPLIQAAPPPVVPLASTSLSMVGEEDTLSNIRRLLEDDKTGIIGIYGMGGIGKTTLLKATNELLSGSFDLVIWVTVSKDLDIEKVQEDIGVRLGYSRPGHGQGPTLPKNQSDRTNTLLRALSKRKFLLLLDDIWDTLDLGAVGVLSTSFVEKKSKVVFTTRSEKVCNDMDAQRKVKVPLLNQASSWKLFCQKLGRGESQWDPSVRSLAEAVAAKCGGLPITLITVGRAMADATDRREWKEALEALKTIPAELGDMKDVLTLLKFSFDRLKDTSARDCLLYCALFPEDQDIDISDLVDYCAGEGLLERGRYHDSIDRARSRGRIGITSLKAACLLEDGNVKGRRVKLHDTVRDMALWITSGELDNQNVFLVNSGQKLTRVPTPEKWTEAKRISLMRNKISELPETPRCHNLHTLFLNANPDLMKIDGGFFQFMPKLCVLDLSLTRISLLPPEIGSLVELRLLNLSYTPLKSLPIEVRNLTRLRQLRLEGTSGLESVPREAISSLRELQSLNISRSSYVLRVGRGDDGSDCESDHGDRQLCLKDLDGMEQLTDLGLSITGMTHEDMQALENSKGLCASMRFLGLMEMGKSSFHLSAFLDVMKGLRRLWIEDSSDLEELIFDTNQLSELEDLTLLYLPRATISWRETNVVGRGRHPLTAAIFENLVDLDIFECEALEDVTWIRELPSLETFYLGQCPKIEELIVVPEVMMDNVDYKEDSFFPKLKVIHLTSLPNLRSICRHPLLFPSLTRVEVFQCPELKKLPFGLGSAKNIQEIRGDKEWGNRLEWDHEDVRSMFVRYITSAP